MASLKRNGENYYDPTPYKAIKNLMESEKENMEIFKGDIFEMEMSNGGIREAVILSVHDNFSQVLMLNDNEKQPYGINCRGLKFTNPAMVQYAFNDKFKDYIRSMSSTEIDDLLKSVVDALGYKAPAVETKVEVKQEAAHVMNPEIEALKCNFIKAQAEKNVYKDLYEKLISSMTAR